jgi:hypothetical protein
MRVSDFVLLAKKIAVGIVITVVPLAILVGPLWITQRTVRKGPAPTATHSTELRHAD